MQENETEEVGGGKRGQAIEGQRGKKAIKNDATEMNEKYFANAVNGKSCNSSHILNNNFCFQHKLLEIHKSIFFCSNFSAISATALFYYFFCVCVFVFILLRHLNFAAM